MARRFREAVPLVLSLTALYAAGCAVGLGLLVLAFRIGLCGGIDILFYRGLVLIAVTTALTFAILALLLRRWPKLGLSLRDAFSAAVLSLSLNLSFLVVVPVTVDRSISIFLLSAMAAEPQRALTPEAASTLFKQVYVDDYHQIDRRLREQAISGNLEAIGGSYKISPRGKLVVDIAKTTAWLFDSRSGLTSPHVPALSESLAARQ